MAGEGPDAERGAQRRLLPGPDETVRLQRRSQTPGLVAALVETGVQHQQGELVAAQPPDRIRFAQIGPEQLSHMHEGGVAGRVAEGVVDVLEAVEIEIQQHRRDFVALAEGHGAAHDGDKATPVQRRRQHVVIGRGLRRLGAQAQGLDLGAQALDLGLGVDGGRVGHQRKASPGRRLNTAGPVRA